MLKIDVIDRCLFNHSEISYVHETVEGFFVENADKVVQAVRDNSKIGEIARQRRSHDFVIKDVEYSVSGFVVGGHKLK